MKSLKQKLRKISRKHYHQNADRVVNDILMNCKDRAKRGFSSFEHLYNNKRFNDIKKIKYILKSPKFGFDVKIEQREKDPSCSDYYYIIVEW